MPSGRTVKLILYEVLEFACLCVPVFVVLERFASLLNYVEVNSRTTYWLVVAASIAYVTSVSLFVWVPLKYFILKSRGFLEEVTLWRPVTLAHALLCTLPCFAIVISSSKVQLDAEILHDHFNELPVSLVLFALICVDIVERIRPYRLRGQDRLDFEVPGPVLTHLEQVSTVSSQLQANRAANGSVLRSEAMSTPPTGRWANMDGISRTSSTAYLYSHSHYDFGCLRFMCVRDPRHELFLETFVFWLDTVEMIRVAGVQKIYYSNWVFPIYILSYFSILRGVLTPHNPMLTTLGVVAQDLPFLVLRVCLVILYGYVTPILYITGMNLSKNLLSCLTFVYFHFLTKLKVFNRGSMF